MKMSVKLLFFVCISFTALEVRGASTTIAPAGGVFCSGNQFSLNCTQDIPEELLQWSLSAGSVFLGTVEFNNLTGQVSTERPFMPLVASVFSGTAILNSISPTAVSTLTLTATGPIDGVTVECSGTSSLDQAVINIITAPETEATLKSIKATNQSLIVDWEAPTGTNDSQNLYSLLIDDVEMLFTNESVGTIQHQALNTSLELSIITINDQCGQLARIANFTIASTLEPMQMCPPPKDCSCTCDPYYITTAVLIVLLIVSITAVIILVIRVVYLQQQVCELKEKILTLEGNVQALEEELNNERTENEKRLNEQQKVLNELKQQLTMREKDLKECKEKVAQQQKRVLEERDRLEENVNLPGSTTHTSYRN